MENADIKKEGVKYPRVRVIDAIRGLSILLMIIHHFAIDLIMYNLIPARLLDNTPVFLLHYFFAGVFIFISGLSSFVSRRNFKRGIGIFLAGMAVTLVTWLFNNEFFVKFGILHFLGVAAILYALAGRAFHKIPRKLSLALIIILFAASFVFTGKTVESPFLFPFNFFPESFVSSDYFPLFPWIFVYFFGSWMAVPVFEKRMPPAVYEISSPFFEFVGKKTMIIYLVHQPVLMGITLLIAFLAGKLG